MVYVERFHIQQYRQNEHYPIRWLWWSLIIAAAAGFRVWVGWSLSHTLSNNWMTIFAVAVASGAFAACNLVDKIRNKEKRMKENGPEYRMIALWLRAGRDLDSFPLNQRELSLAGPWAFLAVRGVGAEVIVARDRRRKFLEQTQSFRTMETDQRISRYYKRRARLDEEVSEAEAFFSDIWELVTAQGIGILIGEDWSDKDDFLARIEWSKEPVILVFAK